MNSREDSNPTPFHRHPSQSAPPPYMIDSYDIYAVSALGSMPVSHYLGFLLSEYGCSLDPWDPEVC